GPAAVVVHTESATYIDVLQPRTHQFQLGVHMRQLVDGVLHPADVLQLASRMAVHELQAIERVAALEHAEHLENLGDEQAAFRVRPGRGAPAPRPFAEELHAHADAWPYLVGFGVLQDQPQLLEVLDHRDDEAPELRGKGDSLDVAVVLEAV